MMTGVRCGIHMLHKKKQKKTKKKQTYQGHVYMLQKDPSQSHTACKEEICSIKVKQPHEPALSFVASKLPN